MEDLCLESLGIKELRKLQPDAVKVDLVQGKGETLAPAHDHAAGDEVPERQDDDHAQHNDRGYDDDAVEAAQVTTVEYLK